MRLCILLCALVVPVLSAPEAKKYREPAPVIEKHGLQSVVPPCKHAAGYKFDASTSALIQSQTQARILNHKNHNLETAASSYSSQTQSAAPSNQIGSGIGSKGSAYQGGTNTFSSGQGYVQNGISTTVSKPPVNFIPLSQVSPPLPLQSQSQTTSSSQGQGYNYNQGFSSQNNKLSQQTNVPAAFPVPPRPGPIGPLPPVQLSSSRPHNPSQYAGQYSSQNYGGQFPSSQFGSQISSPNFGGQHYSSNFGAQLSSSQFGGRPSSSNFGEQQSPSNYKGQLSAPNFNGQQSTSNFGSQVSSSSNYASQYDSSLFGGQHNNAGFASFPSSSLGSHGLNGQLGHVIRETVANAPLDPSADKHIYVHIPPEDLEKETQASAIAPQFIAPSKKHYKIVFIKAPNHPTPNYSQLAAASAPKVEEKTLIYVLVKKPEQPSVDDLQQLQQPAYKSSKPEVYFIKYKTQKEGDATHNSAFIPSASALSTDQIDFTTSNPLDQIDIRSGGNGNESPKHELYGVPLQ